MIDRGDQAEDRRVHDRLLFIGMDLGVQWGASWLMDSELQRDRRQCVRSAAPRIIDSVVGFDPYNNPPAPRMIGLVLTKRFG